MDDYQERYLKHKETKLNKTQIKNVYNENAKGIFQEILNNRKSVRRFNKENTILNLDNMLEYAISVTPSSCNRHGIYLKQVEPKYAEQILVGGKKWIDKADKVYFMFGAKQCYKNPREIDFMPYLDTGFLAQTIYLLCELESIGCCFVNPNKTEELENEDYFCGAIAFGDYE